MPRPRSPLLSVDAIVGTALSLVDAFGNFSFPKVAKELGVSQSALYSYIENRAHIIELMRGPVLSSRHPLNMEDLSWEDALRTLAHGYRERLLEHPRLVPHLVTQTVRDLGVMGIYEDMVIVLGKAGLAGSAVVPAITTVDYLVPGSALELAAPEVVWSPRQTSFPRFLWLSAEGLPFSEFQNIRNEGCVAESASDLRSTHSGAERPEATF